MGPATPQFVGAPERGDWFRNNDAVLRSSPLYVGATAVALLVLNRALSGEALAVDASTAQSRAEVLVLALSTSLVLTGLNWVALTPRAPARVELHLEAPGQLDRGLGVVLEVAQDRVAHGQHVGA